MNELKKTVKNVPAYAWDYPVWMVTEVDCELWFYGAYELNQKDAVNEEAMRLDKVVLVD